METSVFIDFLNWAGVFVGTGVAQGISYDMFKHLSQPFFLKLKSFFSNKTETEVFLKKLIECNSKNPSKPYRDIEDIYEEVTGKTLPNSMIDELKDWTVQNKEEISSIINNISDNKLVINKQKAERDINIVQGVQKIINKK